jgi:hypothetical protein
MNKEDMWWKAMIALICCIIGFFLGVAHTDVPEVVTEEVEVIKYVYVQVESDCDKGMHAFGKWSVVDAYERRDYTALWVVQKRTCEGCSKIELRKEATYLR